VHAAKGARYAATPDEAAVGFGHDDPWVDDESMAVGFVHLNLQPSPALRRTLDTGMVRIPLRVGGQISQDLPDPLCGMGQIDLGLDFDSGRAFGRLGCRSVYASEYRDDEQYGFEHYVLH
jgi:hypothetical protein